MMTKIIDAIKVALTDLFGGADALKVINDLLTAIFGTVAEEEGFKYPEA